MATWCDRGRTALELEREGRWPTSDIRLLGCENRFRARGAARGQRLRARTRHILEPGQNTIYHAESDQEAFLVLSGECRLLVENEERRLRRWDFFHSPPWTEHAFVGAGETPCVILMAGTRSADAQARYPASKLAAEYGASVEEETSDPMQVYATVERFPARKAAVLDSTALGLTSCGVH
jgi:uncharacterized cupin superfamily protein